MPSKKQPQTPAEHLSVLVARQLADIVDDLDNWPLRKPSLGDLRGLANRIDGLREWVLTQDKRDNTPSQ